MPQIPSTYCLALIAGITHEANRAYCATLGEPPHSPWNSAPQWQRDSAIKDVTAALADPEMMPEKMHQAWFAWNLGEGWSWGPKKDPEKREHPNMVVYAALPVEQQVKYALFLAIVRALAPLLGAGAEEYGEHRHRY